VLTINPEPLDSDDARRLIGELDAHLHSMYPPEDNFTELPFADAFMIARDDGRAVGCGAVRFIDEGVGEVKRMYVMPAARGNGVGREIMSALETFAISQGAHRLVLETGPKQLEAIKLYERFGFTRTDCWGEYAHAGNSICYAKPLHPD